MKPTPLISWSYRISASGNLWQFCRRHQTLTNHPRKKQKHFLFLHIFSFFFFHYLWSRFRTPVETGAMSDWSPPLPSPLSSISPPAVWRRCYLLWQTAAVCRASPSAPAADSALSQTQTRQKIEHPLRFATIKLAEMKRSCADLECLCRQRLQLIHICFI